MRDLVRRIDAATPAARDRAVDALRAFAILGVVLGHWTVTALVADSGTLRSASPLLYMPELTPLSWAFQTLAVFFLVGGLVGARSYVSARAKGIGYGRWLGTRLARLFRPVAVVLAVWTVAVVVMLSAGVDDRTLHTLCKLVLSPLWFLLVFAVLTALTPLATRLHPLWPFAVVLHVDVIRFGLDGPEWLNSMNVLAGWLVPYCLGAAWARGAVRSRVTHWMLLLGGAAACAGLVVWAGYPAAMVGVPGHPVSNLDPPNLATVTFGAAQCGAALLLLGPLRRMLARPGVWAAVAMVNLSAMTIFLWHQTSMMAVTAIGFLAGDPLPGMHTVPDNPGWVLARLAWLPAFATALLVCWTAFRTYEQARPRGSSLVVRQSRPVMAEAADGRTGRTI
ncbi:acyltransferase [Streptomyces sp. PCS3-D2]|uniref:acyltransferase family protein n=1 Tax=Streptomyces sp. PCS3-D2 TaxID=1460244 RepID=UPI0004524139|nr:acyltransferase [Streptomyces sp. PCS3-D2]WKV71362.1 acyltransferase [Streptomyces sp. PCS3-D2]